jgi:hypothetical protein
LNWAFLSIAICSVFLLGHIYESRYFIAWGDETMFAEIAETFATHGVLGAPSFEGNGLKMAERTYFMPPVYPVLLSGWFHLFPSTLGNARLFSNVAAVLCILGVFALALRLSARGVVPGLLTIALAVDVQFASMFNVARPEMLACALSILSVWVYISGKNERQLSLPRLAIAYLVAVGGMLTHPIVGIMGFLVIPLHILIAQPSELRRLKVWAILAGIPLLGLCLWGVYILQDIDTFKHQFIDWQTARKSGRFAGAQSYVGMVVSTVMNFGVKGDGFVGSLSTMLVGVLGLKTLGERDRGHPALLVLLLVLLSGLAVNYGREMWYSPLRLPPFYLALAICIDTPLRFRSWARIRQQVLLLRYAPLVAVILLLVMSKSTVATIKLISEITKSERAEAYSPSTLAQEIMKTIPKGSSIGIKVYPDCFDILSHSGHFSRVNRLSWTQLTSDELLDYVVRRNHYLAITDSVLEPHNPGHHIDFTDRIWGASDYYREIASRYFSLEKAIVLPGGGTTKIYKRDSSKVPEDMARKLADPQH